FYSSFFYHAAEATRLRNVTGVQTCALPITRHHDERCDLRAPPAAPVDRRRRTSRGWLVDALGDLLQFRCDTRFGIPHRLVEDLRSEERRVGKEGTTSGYPVNQNNNVQIQLK